MIIHAYMIIHSCNLITKINGKVNQHQYKEILEVGLSLTIFYFYELNPRSIFFQQVNASIHNTKILKQRFRSQYESAPSTILKF